MAMDELAARPKATESTGAADAAETGAGTESVLDTVLTVAAPDLATYPIAPGYRLNVRSAPRTDSRRVRVLPEGSRVTIHCQTPGESVRGPYGRSSIWDKIGPGEYVSDTYVKTGSDGYVAPRCS
ncbi:SH3 domain-containing protein [Streptomyces sp. KR80]|uniref:SH3 domain-containing protein n=1 Tax=Streptomyces sp. KR80 TaxID=3457426 RepID=UPI003FD3A705